MRPIILHSSFHLGEPLRRKQNKPHRNAVGLILFALASGYPLHHLRARVAVATVVPLLSLSLPRPSGAGIALRALVSSTCGLLPEPPTVAILATNPRAKPAKARGIVAEPPAKPRSGEAGDVADSPTQAAKGGEAARPTSK